MFLRQPVRERRKSLTAIAGAGDDHPAVDGDADTVALGRHKPRGVGVGGVAGHGEAEGGRAGFRDRVPLTTVVAGHEDPAVVLAPERLGTRGAADHAVRVLNFAVFGLVGRHVVRPHAARAAFPRLPVIVAEPHAAARDAHDHALRRVGPGVDRVDARLVIPAAEPLATFGPVPQRAVQRPGCTAVGRMKQAAGQRAAPQCVGRRGVHRQGPHHLQPPRDLLSAFGADCRRLVVGSRRIDGHADFRPGVARVVAAVQLGPEVTVPQRRVPRVVTRIVQHVDHRHAGEGVGGDRPRALTRTQHEEAFARRHQQTIAHLETFGTENEIIRPTTPASRKPRLRATPRR